MSIIISNKIENSDYQWTNRQPEDLNYLRPNGFRFMIQSMPNTTYFCQSATIPTVTLGYATQNTPIVDIPFPGEKVTYGELTIRFMIQENMSNYIELYEWMANLGGVDNGKYAIDLRTRKEAYRVSDVQVDATAEERPARRKTDKTDFSDATLLILGSDFEPVGSFLFQDCFPISLSGVDFDVSSGNVQYLQASATFKYRLFFADSLKT